MKLGSLFDGIGGFPYAGLQLGIEPVWASEIEPFPIRVTEYHFPNMKHLGDITKINGAEIEPVDIITFGSPCQDLSVAGKREGLAGARSGLFMDAVRIIRGMRSASNGVFPRFAVWENVPGAFSSNNGEDFRAVLEEISQTEIPMPASGKWGGAGMVRTERVDIAWRTIDAQHWGVPQRRRRIFLVADYRGQCAGEILFKSESLRGNIAESREAREEASRDVGDGIKNTIFGFIGKNSAKTRGIGLSENLSPTIDTTSNVQIAICPEVFAIDHVITGGGNCTAQGPCVKQDGPMFALKAGGVHAIGVNGRQDPCCYGDKTGALDTDGLTQCVGFRMLAFGEYADDDSASTLKMRDHKDATDLIIKPIPIHDQATRYNGKHGYKQDGKGNGFGVGNPGDPMNTLGTTERHAVAYPDPANALLAKANLGFRNDQDTLIRNGYAVRRLTPLECERLQGFPDNWTNIPGTSDTARYKAIGNSVAIPCVLFVLGGIARVLRRAA